MPLPRFEAETKIPLKAVLMPRHDDGRRAIFLGGVQASDGTYRYILKTELKPNGAGEARWAHDRFVTISTLLSRYDLRPYGWLPIDDRQKATRKVGAHYALDERIDDLEKKLEALARACNVTFVKDDGTYRVA